MPNAPVIYAADMAGLPYGAKNEAEVAARVAGLLGRMAERYQPRLICIACNTASHHRAGHGARGAGNADRRHRSGDQARRAMTKTGVIRAARHRGDDPPSLCRRPRARLTPRARSCCATAPRPRGAGRDASCAAARSARTRLPARLQDWSCSTAATASTRWCSPARIFLCSARRTARGFRRRRDLRATVRTASHAGSRTCSRGRALASSSRSRAVTTGDAG